MTSESLKTVKKKVNDVNYSLYEIIDGQKWELKDLPEYVTTEITRIREEVFSLLFYLRGLKNLEKAIAKGVLEGVSPSDSMALFRACDHCDGRGACKDRGEHFHCVRGREEE